MLDLAATSIVVHAEGIGSTSVDTSQCGGCPHINTRATKLAKTARDVLQALQPKQSDVRTINRSTHQKTRPNVVVSCPDAHSVQIETARRRPCEEQRAAAGQSAVILGKRRRHDMGHPTIAIHEDRDGSLQESRRVETMRTKEMSHPLSDDGDSVSSSLSEDSDDSDEEIDESVIEDMRKLEENFKGISERYRLINRIGEGESRQPDLLSLAYCLQGHSRPCTKLNNFLSRMRWIRKTTSPWMNPIQRCHPPRGGKQALPPACLRDCEKGRELWH